MKIVYKISLFFAVLLSVSACKLDQYSDSTIPIETPKDVFKTFNDAQWFATGLSSYFRATTYGVYAQTPDIQGDMFNACVLFGGRGGNPHTMNSAFTPSDYDVRAVWDGYYSSIKGYNYFLENIHFVQENKEISLSKAERAAIDMWKGYAHFFRAYTYFELAKKFCGDYEASSATSDLGLPMVFKYDINAKPKRESLQKTFDLIQLDLDSAAMYLKLYAGEVRAIEPNADAVKALQARVSLWTEDWATAATLAGELINAGAYTLAKTKAEMQSEWVAENGPEDIMQLFSSVTESPRSISIFIGSFYGIGGGQYYYNLQDFFPTQRLYELYAAGDIRRDAYFEKVLTQYGSPVAFVKYKGNPALTTAPYYACNNQAKVFRIAEMYLIKAEAEARQGLPTAKVTLNELQVARGAAPTGGTLEEVQTEWARETPGEGVRVECLKRWHLGFKNRPAMPENLNEGFVVDRPGYTEIEIPADYYKFTWPIPTNDMTYNENLVQNKGW